MAEDRTIPNPADATVRTHYHTGYNVPGYLPDTPADVWHTFSEAQAGLAEAMADHAGAEADASEAHDCDDIPCPTDADACRWQRAGELRLERDELLDGDGPEWSGVAADYAYWIRACTDDECAPEQDPPIPVVLCVRTLDGRLTHHVDGDARVVEADLVGIVRYQRTIERRRTWARLRDQVADLPDSAPLRRHLEAAVDATEATLNRR